MKQNLIAGTCDVDILDEENGIILISNGNARDMNTKVRYFGKLSNYKVNDVVTLTNVSGAEYQIRIVGIIENNLLDRDVYTNTINFISIASVQEKLLNEVPKYINLAIDLVETENHFIATQLINGFLINYPSALVTDYVDLNDTE